MVQAQIVEELEGRYIVSSEKPKKIVSALGAIPKSSGGWGGGGVDSWL